MSNVHPKGQERLLQGLTYFCFFDPLWVFSVFSADLSLEWLESRESTDSLDLPRLRSLSLCFLRRSISRRRSTGSSLYFPSACQKEKSKLRFWGFRTANSTTHKLWFLLQWVEKHRNVRQASHIWEGCSSTSHKSCHVRILHTAPAPFSKIMKIVISLKRLPADPANPVVQ